MTIDGAIEHAEEVARTCDDSQCAKDHAQLADWLRELRRARMEIDLLKTLRDGFKADAQKYKAENAKMIELVNIGNLAASHCESLTEKADRLSAENAKLRTFAARLVRQLFDYTQNPVTRGVICDEARELGIEVDDG